MKIEYCHIQQEKIYESINYVAPIIDILKVLN